MTWDVILCRPGPQPFHRLAAALTAAWDTEISETDQFIQAEKLGTELASGTGSLARALEFFLDRSRGTDRVLLVIDQFEELFTLTPPTDRSQLVRALLQAIDTSRVTVVLTLRADFYTHAITLDRDLSTRLAAGIVNVGPMRRDELRRAIEKPAESVGLVFEAGLVDRILDHVEGEPGSLPLLEFALTELWARRHGARLEHEQYKALGQVDGAIGKRATEVFGTLSPEAQRGARTLMTRLVRVVAASEDGSDTRQRVSLSALDEGARTAMKPFADARLLVVGRDEASGEETVELAHEALIRSWPELREMLENDRRFLLWRQRLRFLLDEWARSNRDEALLLRGSSVGGGQTPDPRAQPGSERGRARVRSGQRAHGAPASTVGYRRGQRRERRSPGRDPLVRLDTKRRLSDPRDSHVRAWSGGAGRKSRAGKRGTYSSWSTLCSGPLR